MSTNLIKDTVVNFDRYYNDGYDLVSVDKTLIDLQSQGVKIGALLFLIYYKKTFQMLRYTRDYHSLIGTQITQTLHQNIMKNKASTLTY